MKKTGNKKKLYTKLIFIVVLLLAITNVITFRIVHSYTRKQDDLKEIAYQNAESINVKKVTKKMGVASFSIDAKRVRNIQNVMIVAHPDDETLWAGDHLMKERYLVICLTNGKNPVRRKEFDKAMQLTGNYGIILNFPDKTNRHKNNWLKVNTRIRNDISYIIGYKNWAKIVTHNPDGEYGHIQHKFTSMMVTEECVRRNCTNQLQYFGKYYKVNYMLKHSIPGALPFVDAQAKEDLMTTVYQSQGYAHRLFDHMIPYEHFIPYKDWYFGV